MFVIAHRLVSAPRHLEDTLRVYYGLHNVPVGKCLIILLEMLSACLRVLCLSKSFVSGGL